MNPNNSRRDFLKKLGAVGVAGGALTVAAPRAWAESVAGTTVRRSMSTMGTLFNISVFDAPEARAHEAIRMAFEEIRLIESLMSAHRPITELSAMNQRSGSEMVALDPRTIETLTRAVEWGRATHGIFDISTLPLLRAWGFREEAEKAEKAESIESARGLVDYRQIRIEGDRAGLEIAGACVDVGAIGKGYAVDRAVRIMREKCGLEKFIVAGCGDIYAAGKPEDADGWTIGVKSPTREPGMYGVIELCDMAVGTSGAYTRGKIGPEGKFIGDEFNPRTGRPVNAFLSATAVAKTCTDADAASTTAFVAANPDPGFLAGRAELMYITSAGAGSRSGYEHAASKGFPKVTVA